MNEWLYLSIFTIYSINSVIEDVLSFRVRLHEIALGIAVVLAVRAIMGDGGWMEALASGAIGALVFLVVEKASKGRLGAGDIWFSAFIGVSFGFWTWDLGLLAAAALAAAWVCALSLSGRRGALRQIRIPFVPFMFAGAIAVALYRGLSR